MSTERKKPGKKAPAPEKEKPLPVFPTQSPRSLMLHDALTIFIVYGVTILGIKLGFALPPVERGEGLQTFGERLFALIFMSSTYGVVAIIICIYGYVSSRQRPNRSERRPPRETLWFLFAWTCFWGAMPISYLIDQTRTFAPIFALIMAM